MNDCKREGHEITIARDGIGYCRRCDDWHDLESLRAANQLTHFALARRPRGVSTDGDVAALVTEAR